MVTAATEGRVERLEAEELLGRYLSTVIASKNLSAYTLRNYSADLRHFFDFLDGHDADLRSVEKPLLREYLSSLVAAGLASGSVTRKVSTMRSFYRHLRMEGVIDADPMFGVRGPRRERRLPHVLSQEQIDAL